MSDLLANGPAARSSLTTLGRLSHWRQPAGVGPFDEGALPMAAWAAAVLGGVHDVRCVIRARRGFEGSTSGVTRAAASGCLPSRLWQVPR